MGSYKWGYKSPNVGCKYSYPTYHPNYFLPMNPQVEGFGERQARCVGASGSRRPPLALNSKNPTPPGP